jgi:hypothetical protein
VDQGRHWEINGSRDEAFREYRRKTEKNRNLDKHIGRQIDKLGSKMAQTPSKCERERPTKKVSNVRVERKCLKRKLRLTWELQVRKNVLEKEGRPWEETEDKKELWEIRDRGSGLAVR